MCFLYVSFVALEYKFIRVVMILFSFCPKSRNQLSTLPVHLCSLPLKVLIASNNKLVSIPEEIGQLRQLTELVSTQLFLNYYYSVLNL